MQVVLLAAGESSRFWPLNLRHKSLIKILGKPIIAHTIDSLGKNGIKDIIIVQNEKKDVENCLKQYKFDANIRYVIQPEPKGMGNALMCAKDLINGNFFVLNSDKIDAVSYTALMIKKHEETGAELVFLGTKTQEPWLYGILKFKDKKIVGLVEKPKKGEEPSNIKVTGLYLLSKRFFEYYERVEEHQYAFEDALDLFIKENSAELVMTDEEMLSLKFPWNLFEVNKYLIDRMLTPKIETTAQISKNVIIEGKVYIGHNTKVFEGAVIKGPCYIGSNCIIGNNALIREYTNIEDGCVIGTNCEVARSIIQESTHTHSGFVGDCIIGKNCRIGAGFISANVRLDRGDVKCVVKGEKVWTGLKRLGTVIGDDTRIGVGVKIMPGVFIGNNSIIGPGSVIFENVEDNRKVYTEFKRIEISK